MAYVKKNNYAENIGRRVILTREIHALAGYFEVGTIVKITGTDPRGYTFTDDKGNSIREAGWDGFDFID